MFITTFRYVCVEMLVKFVASSFNVLLRIPKGVCSKEQGNYKIWIFYGNRRMSPPGRPFLSQKDTRLSEG